MNWPRRKKRTPILPAPPPHGMEDVHDRWTNTRYAHLTYDPFTFKSRIYGPKGYRRGV